MEGHDLPRQAPFGTVFAVEDRSNPIHPRELVRECAMAVDIFSVN
jgi:hypothetical protein